MATHPLDRPASMLTATSTSPGFSEPGAGSDLASLRPPTTSTRTSTSARGHKVWTCRSTRAWVEQAVGHAALSIGSAVYDGGDDTGLNVYLYSRAQSVMGGTSQMQRNLIARRILELPA